MPAIRPNYSRFKYLRAIHIREAIRARITVGRPGTDVMKNMRKHGILIVSFIVLALAAVSMSGMILTSSDDADGDPLPITSSDGITVKGNTTIDFNVYSESKIVIDGTYSGTVRLFSEKDTTGSTLLCSIVLNGVSGITIKGDPTQPYATGNMTGSMYVTAGTISLGKMGTTNPAAAAVGFTGTVSGADGSATFSDIVGALITVKSVGGHNSIVVSGNMTTSNNMGFGVTSSYSATEPYIGSDGNAITMQGLISNELLGNSISVSYHDDTYYLSGTLAKIDRSGSSSIGTLFDFIMGTDAYTYAIVVGVDISGTTSPGVVDLGGQVLIGVSSSSDTFKIGGKNINLSDMTLSKNGSGSERNVTGISGKVTLTDRVILDNVSFGPDVAVSSEGSTSTTAGAKIHVLGSLSISGSFDALDVGSITTDSKGVISSTGSFRILSSYDMSKTEIHSVCYDTDESGKSIRCYTDLHKAIVSESPSHNAKIYVTGSCVVRSNEMIPSGMTLTNNGCLFIDRQSVLTVSGTLVNSKTFGCVISEKSFVDTFRGTFTNNGYSVVYGAIKIKGSNATPIYADVSHYNNTWTVYASLTNILSKAAPGDTFILKRDSVVRENLTLPEDVTLNLLHNLSIADGKIFTVNGKLNFECAGNTGSGLLYIGANGTANIKKEVTLVNISVSGSLVISETGKATIGNSAVIGDSPSAFPYVNTAKITGRLDTGSAYVLVYGVWDGFAESHMTGTVKRTAMYSGTDLYATEYCATDRDMFLPSPTLNGLGFVGWYDNSALSGKQITTQSNVKIGALGSMYAYTSDTVYHITFSYNPSVIWIWDSVYAENIVNTVYGEHHIDVDVKNGYTGTPVIYMDGVQIERGSTIMVDRDIVMTVSGISSEEPEPKFETIWILIAVLIVISLSVVAVAMLRMRRS